MQDLLHYHLPGRHRPHAIVCCNVTSLWRAVETSISFGRKHDLNRASSETAPAANPRTFYGAEGR